MSALFSGWGEKLLEKINFQVIIWGSKVIILINLHKIITTDKIILLQ